MRRGPRLSESARLPPCCAVDSHTERKQTTWSTTPAATASAASITGPSWPAVSPVPRCHRVRSPSASWSWVEPAPLNPGPPPAAPGYDATPSMSSGVSPASSIARRHASTVSARPERPSRRPICDTPTPLTTALPPSGLTTRRDVTAPTHRHEDRDPDVVPLLEPHGDRHPDVDVPGVAVDDVGGQPNRRVVVEFDDRDGVRRGESGQPLVHVHAHGGHGGEARDRLGSDIGAAAAEARRCRWMEQTVAGLAAVDQQFAVRAALPERS